MALPDPSALEVAASQVAAGAVAPTPEFIDAWRQLHHAAQLASEVGKAWATPCADDSHSAFGWRDGEIRGASVAAPIGFRASLRVRDLTLRLVAADGAALASKSLDGLVTADGVRWIRGEAERLAGPSRQQAVAAPDLPAHPVANGAPFAARAAELAALAHLLGGADALLRGVAASRPTRESADAQRAAGERSRCASGSPVSIWPHHFDMATLLELDPQRTIGVGLAVPDGLDPSGYWYVSAWAAEPPAPAATVWPALAHGRWVERGGALRMAALPLDVWGALGDARARRAALAGFLATSLGASVSNFAR